MVGGDPLFADIHDRFGRSLFHLLSIFLDASGAKKLPDAVRSGAEVREPELAAVGVLIIDDCPATRLGLRSMLSSEPSISVVGEADTPFGALEQTAILQPDVVLLDLGLPRADAPGLVARMRQRHPGVKLVLLVDHELEATGGTLPAGGDGYLSRSTTQRKLVDTILSVFHGERVLDSGCAGLLLDGYEAAVRELARVRVGLSSQEVELLSALAGGATNREIAARMYLSEITVIRKVQQVVSKLGATNRIQAVAEAVRRCII